MLTWMPIVVSYALCTIPIRSSPRVLPYLDKPWCSNVAFLCGTLSNVLSDNVFVECQSVAAEDKCVLKSSEKLVSMVFTERCPFENDPYRGEKVVPQ